MKQTELLVVIFVMVINSVAAFYVGGVVKQTTIIEECAKYQMYTDRKLVMQCHPTRVR